MSEPQEKLDISDLKDNFLECPVCVEHFNQSDRRPRLLHSCLHAFCTQCLHQLLVKEGKGQITCPLCRNVQKVTGKADTLPVDTVRSKLVEYVQIKHSKKVLCTDCPDGNEAETRCQECSLYLCKDCTYVHKRHRLTNDHSVMPLEAVLEQPLKSFSKGHFCSHHPKHHLEFYCVTDESLCCLSCTVLEHQGHKFQKVEEAVKTRQQELESALTKVNAHAEDLRKRRQEEEKRKMVLQKEQVQAKADVTKHFTKLQRMINQRKEAVLNDIDSKSSMLLSSCEKNLAAMDQSLAMTESTNSYFKKAKENSDAVEMLQMYPSLKRSLGGSRFEATKEEENQDNFHMMFVPSFIEAIEMMLPETGKVMESAAAADKDTKELASFVTMIFTMALESKNKKEFLAQITDNKQTKPTLERSCCSKCRTQMNSLRKIRCKHLLCPRCFDTVFKPTEVCPVCNRECKVRTGHMPPGKMTSNIVTGSLPGYEGYKTIEVRYNIPNGTQTENHRRPGFSFTGINTKAYLPDSPEGRKVLALLTVAWERRLTFEIARDFMGVFKGVESDCIRFLVPHETDWGYKGYRDPNYLKNVQKSLARLGVTEDDLETSGI